jgi:sec-independent protein translocase protein TatA
MPFGIGPLELVIVLVIVLVIFGPKRLPGLGRSLGTGMREFKDSISGKDESEHKPEEPADPQRIERTAEPSAAKGDGNAEAVEKPVSGGERRG